MMDSWKTTTALLDALRDSDDQAVWWEFDARYRPVLIGLGRKLGLNEDAAIEVAQQSLVDFMTDYRRGRYDRGQGRLRSWMIGIARHRILDAMRAVGRQQAWRGESVLAVLGDDERISQIWDDECERTVLSQALNELRQGTRTSPNTLRAFELVVLKQVPAAIVADECGLSVTEVYRIKHRLTKRLREIVSNLSGFYGQDL